MDDTIHGIRQARILQWVDMTFSTFALTGDKLNLKVPQPRPPQVLNLAGGVLFFPFSLRGITA